MTCTTTLVTLVSQERVAEPLPVCNDQSLVRVSPVKEVPKKKLPGMIHTTQENINKLFRVSGKRKASEFDGLRRSDTMASEKSAETPVSDRPSSHADGDMVNTNDAPNPPASLPVHPPTEGLNFPPTYTTCLR